MPAPGVPVLEGERLPGNQRSAGQVDTGLFFGPALRGPTGRPIAIDSAAEIAYWLGDPFGGSHLHRALIAFFADGGSRAYVIRPVDNTAAVATADVDGTGSNPVLTLTADGPGAWANSLTLDVAAGSGGRKLLTLKESGVIKVQVEAGSTEEAVGRLSTPGLVTVTAGSQAWPPTNTAANTPIAMAGGVSADSAVTDADVIESFAFANRELGPCTAMAPGYTSATVLDALFRFARTNGHHALGDLPDIEDVNQLAAMGAALRGLDSEKAGRHGQLLWPWEVVSIGPYLNVSVPPSGGLAGRMARTDRDHPKRQARAAAGPTVVSRQAIGVTRVPTDAEWDILADAGITVIRKEPEGVCSMGAKTVVDGDRWPQYLFAAGHRTRMAIVDQARAAVRPYLFDALDGEGVRIETLRGVVENVCRPYSQEPRGGLYSENGDLGYLVTITSTQAELAQGKVRIQLSLRTTPSIDMVLITFTAIAVGDRL
jgi:hypothetical protein